ncbi:hypothetical protein D3C78_880370 [compost metagenome]
MTFGFYAKNDDSFVQIDSEKPRLCMVHKGNYAAPSGFVASVVFPAPITTQEPPCIFIRPSTTSATELYRYLNISGSPGNWTGFSIEAANVTYSPSGKWFAAVFASPGNSQFGLRLFDGGTNLVYDSGAPAVIFTKASNSWVYVGQVHLEIANAYYYRTPVAASLTEDEYLMLNPFSRSMPAHAVRASSCGIRMQYSGGYLEMYLVNVAAWTDIGRVAAVFAKLSV